VNLLQPRREGRALRLVARSLDPADGALEAGTEHITITFADRFPAAETYYQRCGPLCCGVSHCPPDSEDREVESRHAHREDLGPGSVRVRDLARLDLVQWPAPMGATAGHGAGHLARHDRAALPRCAREAARVAQKSKARTVTAAIWFGITSGYLTLAGSHGIPTRPKKYL
jgi:hypothetical protein